MNRSIPVLLYHSVSHARPDDPFAVTPSRFAEHVEALVRSGRTPVTVTELADGLRGTRPLPDRAVAVTFDDGYPDSLSAIETLHARGIKSTLYVATGAVCEARGIPAADLAELTKLAPEVELGAHSVSHPHLDELAEAEAAREIRDSRRELEELIGRTVESFAYPHGSYDAAVRRLVVEAGFSSAAAVKNALSHPGDDPWAIARWTVRATTTADALAAVLAGKAPLAWREERTRTRLYRSVRRFRRGILSTQTRQPPSPFTDLVAPVAVREVDVSALTADVAVANPSTGEERRSAVLFVRDGRDALGWVSLPVPPSGVLRHDALAAELAERFPPTDGASTRSQATDAVGVSDDLLSVVVTTCAQPDAVIRCVQTIRRTASGPHEVIVVENRPQRSAVADALAAAGLGDVIYVEEAAQGLSQARNAGLRAARGSIVAFLDDDIVVDRHWMESVRGTFASVPSADCVTGLILPLELETPAQLHFERFAGFSKGFQRRVFTAAAPPADVPMFPYTPGHFGSGANSAFRRQALLDLDGFDPALGTGTITRGAEDLDLYIRLILGGGELIYEPAAIVWHQHPDTAEELEQRAFSYGVGLGALAAKLLMTNESRRGVLRISLFGLVYLLSPRSRKNAGRGESFPGRLKRLELTGLAVGPPAYLVGRRRARIVDQREQARVLVENGEAGGDPQPRQTIWCGQLELTAPSLPQSPVRAADGKPFDCAHILIRVVGAVIGFVEVETDHGVIHLQEVLRRAAAELGPAIDEELAAYGGGAWDGRDAVTGAFGAGPYWRASTTSTVSVVVCTRGGEQRIAGCIESLQQVDYPHTEILIVDNAPDDDATEAVVRRLARTDPRIRYVREVRPGLSYARNRALRETSADIVAFTDDDVRVDPLWLDGILRGFDRDQNVACVTGLVASASLELAAEQYFHGRVSWSSDCRHSLHVLRRGRGDSPLHPYAPGRFGTGANIAVRRSALREIGEFDECLGVGSPTAGGEDLDMFVRVLRAGYALSYEPTALVWHHNPSSEASLRQQMYGYGKGLAAYLTKYVSSPQTGPDIAKRLLFGVGHAMLLARRSRRTEQSAGLESDLLGAELLGLIAGPGAYLRARRAQDAAHRARAASQ